MLEYDKKKGEVSPSPFLYEIESFKKVLSKDNATKLITYIFHIASPLSPYSKYKYKIRQQKIIDAVFNGDSKQVLDKEGVTLSFLQEAIDEYEHLTETSVTRALDAAQSALHKIRDFFNDVDFSERTNSGAAVYKPRDILKTTGELNKASKDLRELEEKLKKEEDEQNVRGGVRLNPFNSK